MSTVASPASDPPLPEGCSLPQAMESSKARAKRKVSAIPVEDFFRMGKSPAAGAAGPIGPALPTIRYISRRLAGPACQGFLESLIGKEIGKLVRSLPGRPQGGAPA